MGKSRDKKGKSPRSNPIGLVLPSNVAKSEEGEVSVTPAVYEIHNNEIKLSTDSVRALLQQLQSAQVEDRDCACNALLVLIRSSSDVQAALNEGVIKILGPLLLDTSASVSHSAAAALHALISIGGDTATKLALEDDILTPIVALLKKYDTCWKPKKEVNNKINTKKATFIEAVATLWILSDSSSTAVDRLHRESIVPFLIQYLDVSVYGSDLVSVVAQCLSTVTEDQGETDYSSFLKEKICSNLMAQTSSSLLKTLGAGILLNLNNRAIGSDLGMTCEDLLHILASTLTLDHRKAASSVMDYLPLLRAADEEDENTMESDTNMSDKMKDCLGATEEMLVSQTTALEILTNLCASDGDDSDYEDYPEEESCSEGSADMDGMMDDDATSAINPELKKYLIQCAIFQLVLEKANLPADNVCEALAQHRSGKTLLNRYETMQCRAFLCLSNLCMLMTVEEMGGSKTLFDIWCNLGRVAFESNHISDQLLEAATTSMRAIIQKLLLHHNDVVHLMKIDDIGVLCQQLTSCTEPLSKVNLVQILGTLGSMAAGTEAPLLDGRAAVVRLTGSVLMETSCRETNLWIAAEALDALFDVFKEDHTDGVAVEIQLVKSLKALAPGFKQKVHAQRRNLAEHQPIIMTAKENLLRFIKYKTRKRC